MAYSPIELLTVYLDARNQRRKVGRLAFKDRQLLFEYDVSFINSGIEFSPIKLPLRPGVSVADTTIFDGLFGVFNDSLPDLSLIHILNRKDNDIDRDLDWLMLHAITSLAFSTER